MTYNTRMTTKLKVGDRVKITGSSYFGWTGGIGNEAIVESVGEYDRTDSEPSCFLNLVDITIKEGQHRRFFLKDIKPLVDDLKVGDKVVLNGESITGKTFTGEVGTVKRISKYEKAYPLEVDDHRGVGRYFKRESVTKVTNDIGAGFTTLTYKGDPFLSLCNERIVNHERTFAKYYLGKWEEESMTDKITLHEGDEVEAVFSLSCHRVIGHITLKEGWKHTYYLCQDMLDGSKEKPTKKDLYGHKFGWEFTQKADGTFTENVKIIKIIGGDTMSQLTTLTPAQEKGLSKQYKALYRLGLVNAELDLTTKGREQLMTFLYEQFFDGFVADREAEVKRIEKKEADAAKA